MRLRDEDEDEDEEKGKPEIMDEEVDIYTNLSPGKMKMMGHP